MTKTKEIEALAREIGKTIKTEQELTAFRQMLTKATVEAALNASGILYYSTVTLRALAMMIQHTAFIIMGVSG